MVYISVVVFDYDRKDFIRDVVVSIIEDARDIDVEILVLTILKILNLMPGQTLL